MRYLSFKIKNYRAIESLTVNLDKRLIPLVGINECGKTTILQAIYSFDYLNDAEYEGRHLNNIKNLYQTIDLEASITAKISLDVRSVIQCLEEVNEEIANGELAIEEDGHPFEYEANDVQKTLGGLEKEFEIEIKRNLNDKSYIANPTVIVRNV